MSLDEKTLIILTPGFAKDEGDSTCIPMQQSFVRSLRQVYPRLNIIILAFHYPFTKQRYNWFGAEVIPFSGRNKGGMTKLLLRQKIARTLKKINHTNQITGLLSFWCGECAMEGKRFADKYGYKHYCWLWGQDAKKENKYPARISPRPDELIAFSDFLQDEFEKNHGIRPRYVITPGINTEQFPVSLKGRTIDIVGAGSLIPLKQYDVFIRIIATIKKQIPNIKAMIVGDGPEKERLQNLVTASGLQSTITLTGELPHEKVLQLMQQSKLFLHPSSYEGFSGVCLEALYAGTPVVSFCRAMKEDIPHWHIVKTNEEMEETAIELLLNTGYKFDPINAYPIEATARSLMKLFNE